MQRPRITTLAVCLAAALAAPAYARLRGPATLPELIAELDAAPQVLFVFHPGDCRLRADAVAALNGVAGYRGTRVQGVMLAPPVEPSEAERLVRDFGIAFPVVFDGDDAWSRAMAGTRLAHPVVLVKQGGRYLPVGDAHDPAPLFSLVVNTLNGRTHR